MTKFDKVFIDLVNTVKEDAIKVLDDSLTYLIAFLSINEKTVIKWDYSSDQTKAYADFAAAYLGYMEEQLQSQFWCDAWGDMFMENSGNFKSFRGQFFTPTAVSELCARISWEEQPVLSSGCQVINDCACGSARMLLAAQKSAYENGLKQPYLVGEDIDGICCKMAAVNLAVHGCFGEVIRHDSLKEPDELRVGYIINEILPSTGRPSIRISYDKKDFWKLRNTVPSIEIGKQMTLF